MPRIYYPGNLSLELFVYSSPCYGIIDTWIWWAVDPCVRAAVGETEIPNPTARESGGGDANYWSATETRAHAACSSNISLIYTTWHNQVWPGISAWWLTRSH